MLHIGNQLSDFKEHQYADQDVTPCRIYEGRECRKMLCLKFDVYGIITASCTTHLAPVPSRTGSTAVPFEQASDYAYISTLFAGSSFRIMAGDLNLVVNQLPPTFYNNNRDGTYGNTFDLQNSLTAKIDYIWLENGRGEYVYARRAICSKPGASDHCYTVGTKDF